MKLKFLSPDKKKAGRVTTKEMLAEAIALLVLSYGDFENEQQVRRMLRQNVKRKRKD